MPHWKRPFPGTYTCGPFTIEKVNYGYGIEWQLLIDEGGAFPTWCNTFPTLRDAKHAAQSIETE